MAQVTLVESGCFGDDTRTSINNMFTDCYSLSDTTNGTNITALQTSPPTLALAGTVVTANALTIGLAVPNYLTTNGAIGPHTAAFYLISKAGVLADTLAAPTATTDDGKIIWIVSATAYAHTVTATGLLQTGAAATNLATFAAHAGAGMALMAYDALFFVLWSVGVSFS